MRADESSRRRALARLWRIACDPSPHPLARTGPYILVALFLLLWLRHGDTMGVMNHRLSLYWKGQNITMSRPHDAAGSPSYDSYAEANLSVRYDIAFQGGWYTVRSQLTLVSVEDELGRPIQLTPAAETARVDEIAHALNSSTFRFGPFQHQPVDIGPAVTQSLVSGGGAIRVVTLYGALMRALNLLAAATIVLCAAIIILRSANQIRCNRKLARYARSLCPDCGYAITVPHDDLCPECGGAPNDIARAARLTLNRSMRRRPV